VTKWSVASWPVGLSVNSANNLLVVSYHGHKLQEFTTCGTLLQNIQLHSDVRNPWHAIHLANDQFVVSCRQSLHCVCIVDVKGTVIQRYGR